jgi:hypothetical protein
MFEYGSKITSRLFYFVGVILTFLNLTLLSGNLLATDSNAPTNKTVIVLDLWAPSHVTYICDSTNIEPTYEKLPLSQWLQSKSRINPNRLPLSKLLTLKQISQPDEMGIVNFEVPVNFDALKGEVRLGVFNNDGDFVERCFDGVDRGTNGRCVIWWVINYDPPGKHDIRAQLTYHNGLDSIEIIGPPLLFESSNVCKFFEGASLFNSSGAILQAKLREQTAKFRIELTTPKGKHLKTITGSTTNGMIELDWDLKDDHGKKFMGDSFGGAFYVMYSGDTRTNAPARDTFNRIPDPSN